MSVKKENGMMCERSMMLEKVQIYGFALNDLCLFLDTHPFDDEALICFDKYKKLFDAAAKEFNDRFGPLKYQQNTNLKRWDWICDPWPWEGDAN